MGAYAALGSVSQSPAVLTVRHAGYDVRSMLASHPSVYLPFARATHPAGRAKVVADDTRLVIDGFTRSASTFAVFAFQLAQSTPVRVARHLHAPAHLIAAARRGVPALVPVRDPESTVLSVAVREPHIGMKQILKSYVRFYRTLLSYRSHFTIATFADVTSDFGSVIRRVNRRFGTSFAAFEHSDANVARCFELIELRSRKGPWSPVLTDFQSGLASWDDLRRALPAPSAGDARAARETFVARPSDSRRAMKAGLLGQWRHDRYARLRAEASSAYDAFISG